MIDPKTHYEYEDALFQKGIHLIAGVDEVGRGALAGPLVVVAVILSDIIRIEGLDDSKKLSPQKREQLHEEIEAHAIAISTVWIEPKEIDRINIYQATKKAMMEALMKLDPQPQHILIDAMPLRELPCPSTSIIGGDGLSASIAAASIVAKVTRDRYMVELSKQFPQFGFENNKGYGTPQHLEALTTHGPSITHRDSFEPVRRSRIKQLSLDF